MVEIGDAAEPSGTVATRLSDAETAALIDALAAAVTRVCATPSQAAGLSMFAARPAAAEENDAVLGAARKVWALLGDDVTGVEIRSVRRA